MTKFEQEMPQERDDLKNESNDNNAEILKEIDEFKKRYAEKEKRGRAHFFLGIDKGRIDRDIKEAGHEGDRELLKLFRRLPEQLEFEPGKTLIIGDNGSGKTTLSKALFLALKKEREVESIKLGKGYHRNIESKIKSFKNADQHARETIYDPNPSEYQAYWLKSAGLAAKLGPAFKVEDFTSGNTVGMEYADFHEIIGKIKSQNELMHKDEAYGISRNESITRQLLMNRDQHYNDIQVEDTDVVGALDEIGDRNRTGGSARQTVEGKATELIHGDSEEIGPGIYFLDEPESGISPMRHKKIEENIDNMVNINEHQGSIVIIPTNSIKLFESDLPRIDLRFPERGIFKPSDYPGYFED